MLLSYTDAWFAPSAHTIKSVPSKLYLKDEYFPALVLPESISVQEPVVPPLNTFSPRAAITLPLKNADINTDSPLLDVCGTILSFHLLNPFILLYPPLGSGSKLSNSKAIPASIVKVERSKTKPPCKANTNGFNCASSAINYPKRMRLKMMRKLFVCR